MSRITEDVLQCCCVENSAFEMWQYS